MEDYKQTTNKHLLGAKLIKTVLDKRFKHKYCDKANTFHEGEVYKNKQTFYIFFIRPTVYDPQKVTPIFRRYLYSSQNILDK